MANAKPIKMKAIVLGGSGFVGGYIAEHLNAIKTSFSGKAGFIKLDITKENEVKNLFEKIKPNVVINSAAMADVDRCEKEKEAANMINGAAVEWLASSANGVNAKFVQISTDYVFDGEIGNYKETDEPNPINEYGKSKLLGEQNALKYDSIVIRIEMPYGINLAKNKNVFFESIIRNLKNGKRVNAAIDQIISPTYIEDVAPAIESLLASGSKGIFHLASKENLSRYEFSKLIAEVFDLDTSNIKKVRLDDFKLTAKRPKKTSLNTEKISRLFKINDIRDNLTEIKERYSDYINN